MTLSNILASHLGIEPMQFGMGWILTFAAVFFLNGYLLLHLIMADFRQRRRTKRLVCILPAAALAALFFLYFVSFFGGKSDAPYMVTLGYFAGFYMCFSIYASGAFFITDVVRAIRGIIRRRKIKQLRLFGPRFTTAVVLIAALCSACAFYVPRHITVNEYNVEMARGDSDLSGIRAVFISDSHIGPAVRARELDRIVELTNEAKPDIIFLGGDIVDEGTPEALKAYMSECFKGFESKYGVWFILGNHDDDRGDTEQVLSYFRNAGIHCLLDETALVSDSFYLIGREDDPLRRQPFAELAADVTMNLPVIVLDHQPQTDETAQTDLTPLQLSGHTHDGQIFPFHILDPFGWFSLNYGRYEKGNLQIIVSSGVGEYAVPVRLGSPAEILVVNIALK